MPPPLFPPTIRQRRRVGGCFLKENPFHLSVTKSVDHSFICLFVMCFFLFCFCLRGISKQSKIFGSKNWRINGQIAHKQKFINLCFHFLLPGFFITICLAFNKFLLSKFLKMTDEPKPAQSSFFLWMNENRDRFYKPGMTQPDLAVIAGDEWRQLPESEKAKWGEKAAEDKERYVLEKAEKIKHKKGGEEHQQTEEGEEQTETAEGQMNE